MTIPALALALLALGAAGPTTGAIDGLVVKGDSTQPVADAEVILCVRADGQLEPVDKTRSDAQGRFRFTGIPLASPYEMQAGANRDGIHYPGPRVRLSWSEPHANVVIAVRDAVQFPNPLVVRKHDIVLMPEANCLRVSETMVIENPTAACYVGQAPDDESQPITLQVSVPADFERTTFEREFFGRRFHVFDGKLVTSIPWTPGTRELKFTYVVPNRRRARVWQRPLDLPTAHLTVTVQPASDSTPQRDSRVVFASGEKTLPAGHLVEVELEGLSLPWTAYGRWAALAVLLGSITVGAVVHWRRNRPPRRATET